MAIIFLITAPALQQSGWSAQQSWAVGVVVPQGALLGNGAGLVWSHVKNITAVVRLPNISATAGVIYVVLSAMAGNGYIMQVAAGLYPNSTSWRVYPMIAQAQGQLYTTVSGYRNQNISPGDTLIMSIAEVNGTWWFSVKDVNTSAKSSCSFGIPSSYGLANGSQYVLALESYTSNASVFSGMQEMKMDSMLLNGVPLAGGAYAYGGWGGSPLFIVGGANPPSFIFCYASGGVVVWGYSRGSESPSDPGFPAFALLVGTAALCSALIPATMAIRGFRRGSQQHGGRLATCRVYLQTVNPTVNSSPGEF